MKEFAFVGVVQDTNTDIYRSVVTGHESYFLLRITIESLGGAVWFYSQVSSYSADNFKLNRLLWIARNTIIIRLVFRQEVHGVMSQEILG